jgi:Domain of unknown function (DUF4262)
MCWQCHRPQATRRDYLAHVRDNIDRCGWCVQAVERSGPHPPFAYTVGLTGYGLHELVVTGMGVTRAPGLLDDVAGHVLHAGDLQPGERVPLVGGPLIEIVRVAEPSAHLFTAVEFYGTGIRAMQLVHADDRGHWPWDMGYRGVRGGQPVLGLRSVPSGTAA